MESGVCVFVTTTILDFVPVFKSPFIANLATRELVQIHSREQAALHAFCIMPEHIHLLLTLPRDQTASVFVGRLKSLMARAIMPELSAETRAKFDMQTGLNRRSFWQRSFRSFVVEGDRVFWQKAEYIHLNPVRRGLVAYAEDYRWSSARLFLDGSWSDVHGLVFDLDGFVPLARD